jgi:regulatory protein
MSGWIPEEDFDSSDEVLYESPSSNQKFKSKPARKVYKKKEPRDFEANPVSDSERAKMLKRAENIVLWHVARREMSAKMVQQKLENKNEFPKELIKEIIQKAIDKKWIDDSRFTENFVASKIKYDKLGKNAIKQKLLMKGIDSETIGEALSEIDSELEAEAALEIAKKSLSKTRDLPKDKRVQRTLGLLARKGYSSYDAFKAINLALEEESQEAE